ncbi:MAG: TOBE domain-containing protein, partial [Cyanobacteriota bacterium]|nr:TOBE domain-containing protein [Cyanobacteriota bacterium]
LHPDPGGTVLVRDRSFLGREHRYCLQTRSGRELIARIDAHKPLPVGSKVKISVAPQNWQLFTREEV